MVFRAKGRLWWLHKARQGKAFMVSLGQEKAMVVFKGKVIVIFRVDGKDI